MALYRINWKKGTPFVEHGELVMTGNKKKTRKIKWPSEKNNKPYSSGHRSIKEAIEGGILHIANLFGDNPWRKRKPEAWDLARCIIKLMRLYRRLEKHHLV